VNTTERIEIPPMDEHNTQLVANVHPDDWVNPKPDGRYNLVVLGAGTAGLVTAIGAAGLGAKVALVERNLMGGDCLNVGCVPSKVLIRSARASADVRDAGKFGIIVPDGTSVDFGAVMERMRRIRSGISKHDSAHRFQDQGIDVFIGNASFSGSNSVEVNGAQLEFTKAVIATGARAMEPPIPGMAEAGFLTNETVFNLTERPDRLVVVGAGPIGCELAQTFQRLGCAVTVLEMAPQALIREDPDAARIVSEALVRDGVDFVCNAKIQRVNASGNEKQVLIEVDGSERTVACDAILIGAGRIPNVDGLNLESVEVDYDARQGVVVDDNLRTTNPSIYAAGDICNQFKFTHTADAAARIVIQNTLFGVLPKKRISALTVPWCTYTDPEIAHVGLNESMAKDRDVAIDTFTVQMADVDRAIAEGDTDGMLKVHVEKGKDTIVGATLVCRHAGDMISEITLAMVGGVGLGTIASVIHPYPTQAEIIKKAGDAFNKTRFTPTVAKVFDKVIAWQR